LQSPGDYGGAGDGEGEAGCQADPVPVSEHGLAEVGRWGQGHAPSRADRDLGRSGL